MNDNNNNQQQWDYDYSTLYNSVQNDKNTYSAGAQYTAMPNAAPVAVQKKPSKAKRVFAFILAAIFFAVAGFSGGYLGVSLANDGSVSNGVVINQSVGDTSHSMTLSSDDGNVLLSDVAAKVSPTVVEIMTEQMTTDSIFGQYVTSGAGSGVIISQDGYILTNAHVIEGAQQIKVTTTDKTEYIATVVGSDEKTDVAVLKIDATGLAFATIGDSDALVVGDFALAVGNPLGSLGGTVTDGIISALNREIVVEGNPMTMLQTNAAVSPGNSGGGLFNSNGELIGIVTAKLGSEDTEGLGFAIPINHALEIANELMTNGYVTGRPILGVSVVTIADASTAYSSGVTRLGVYIADVTAGSGADKAGLQIMDYIVSANNVAIDETNDLLSVLETLEVGDVVELQIIRGDEVLTVPVTLQESTPSGDLPTELPEVFGDMYGNGGNTPEGGTAEGGEGQNPFFEQFLP